jgi:predicted O-methyltransferase YrrM
VVVSVQDEYDRRCWLPSDIVQHLPRLHEEASIGDAVVVELGVRSGNSTAAFLAAVDEHGGHVYSVDCCRPQVSWFGHPQWTFRLGDDMTLVDDAPDCDVLFIDTSHHYRHTLAELEAFVPKVRPGGVVLMHDTELETPEGAPDGDPPFPVRTAVEEYCTAHGLTPEFVSGCYGLGVIRVPEEAVDG